MPGGSIALSQVALSQVALSQAAPAQPAWASVLEAWAWPFVTLVAVTAVLFWITMSTAARPILTVMFGRVRKISAFGVEFDLTQAAAVQTRTNVEAGFDELRTKLKRQFDALIDGEGLNNKLLDMAENVVRRHLTPEAQRSFRCTIHIQDVLFEDALYQLTDYYPLGGGRGRTLSIRFGMIGRCARRSLPDIQTDVTTNASKLVESWAMTTAEAAVVGRDRQSFAAVPLFDDDHQLLGIFYVDAVPRDAWVPAPEEDVEDHALCASIQEHARDYGLAPALARIMSEMRRTGPRLRLIK